MAQHKLLKEGRSSILSIWIELVVNILVDCVCCSLCGILDFITSFTDNCVHIITP